MDFAGDIRNIIDGNVSTYNITVQNSNSDLTENVDTIYLGNKSGIVAFKEKVQKLYNGINKSDLTTIDSIKKDGQTLVKIDVNLQYGSNSYKNYSIYTYIDNTSYDELKNMQ